MKTVNKQRLFDTPHKVVSDLESKVKITKI